MYIKDEILKMIIGVCDEVCGTQDEEGKFVGADSRYVTYNQYVGYYFAYLFTHPNEINPYYRNGELLERAIKGWDHYYSKITDSGLTNLSTDGVYWFDWLDEWGCYYWINTIELLKPHLNDAKLLQWNECIDRIMEAVLREIDKQTGSENYQKELDSHTVQNHFIWTVLCYYRYGMVRGDDGILIRARSEMERILHAQAPSGTWLEGWSPVVRYSEVTICAVSLFEIYDNNKLAETKVKNNLQFVLSTIYPDFRKNECVDGRNRYSPDTVSHTAPTFWKYEEGRAYLTQWISQIRDHQTEDHKLGKQLFGLAAITDWVSHIPEEAECSERKAWDYVPPHTRYEELKINILRESGWVISMCCLEPVGIKSRWFLERQNLISVYHHQSGLLVGGGHSISQPEFSCFNLVSGGNLYYLHQEGKLHEEGMGMSLTYGGRSCSIALAGMNESELRLVYRVDGLDETERVYVHIPMWIQPERSLRYGKDNIRPEMKALSQHIATQTPFGIHNTEFVISKEGMFSYPYTPYNSYKRKQEQSFTDVFAVIRVELDYYESSCELTIRL